MIGTQIGNYRIIEKLGEGGMGEVYRAVDVMLERDVALKFLRPELAGQPDLVERFRSEAVVLARLHHPNIASIYGLYRDGEHFCMAMEFVRGETLEITLARDGVFTAGRTAAVAADVLAALDYAHRQGIVHRDIKTANIIVGADGVAKVMDFGIARVLGGQRHTKVGFIVGTLAYMSPEQIKGEELDGRSDLYSLGIVLYEMLAGRPPFQADTEWALMQAQVQHAPPPLSTFTSVGPPLENVVHRALEKVPADRFQSASEFRQALVDSGALAPTVVVGTTLPPSAQTARVTPLPFASPHAETALHVPVARPGTGAGITQPVASTPPTPFAAAPAPTPQSAPDPVTPPAVEASAEPPAARPKTQSRSGTAKTPKGTRSKRGTKTPAAGVSVPQAGGEEPPAQAEAARAAVAPTSAPVAPKKAAAAVAVPVPKATPARSSGSWVGMAAAAVLVVAVAGGGAWWMLRGGGAASEPAAEVVELAPLASRDLVVGYEPIAPITPAVMLSDVVAASAPAPGVRAAQPRVPTSSTATLLPPTLPGPPPIEKVEVTGRASRVGKAVPTAASLPPLRFSKVKLVRSNGDVDALLELSGDKLVVLNANGSRPFAELPYSSITSATYTESKHTRLVVQTRRYWLTLATASGETKLRLDKDNSQLIVESFKQRTGKPVAVAEER